MDFAKVVKKLLAEADPTGPASASPGDLPKAKEFLKNKKSNLQADYVVFKNFLGVDVFPMAEFETIIDKTFNLAIRDTKDFQQIPKFLSAYPLLDLFASIQRIFIDNQSDLNKANSLAEGTYNEWKKRLANLKGSAPLDFIATNTWATSIKDYYLSKQTKFNVGELKYDAYGAVSIADGIYKLMAQRASSGFKKLPPEHFTPSALGENVNPFLQKILETPKAYTSGTIPYPDKKMEAIYGQETPSMILEVATHAYNLFEQQLNEKVLKYRQNQNYEINSGLYDAKSDKVNQVAKQEAYKFFLNNKIVWSTYIKNLTSSNAEVPKEESYSFENIFVNLTSHVLKEALKSPIYTAKSGNSYVFSFNFLDGNVTIIDAKTNKTVKTLSQETIGKLIRKYKEGKKGAESINGTELIQHLNQLSLGKTDNLAKSAAATAENILQGVGLEQQTPGSGSSEEASNVNTPSTFDEGKYSFADIKKYKDENKYAENLYQSLEELSNYTRKAFDWEAFGQAGGKFLKALGSLGSPQVGGKN